MGIMDRLEQVRDKVIADMSKVSCEHITAEEDRIRAKENLGLNYNVPDRFCKKNNVKVGQVDDLQVREITNGKDVYTVKDLQYTFHFEGRTSAWQYGVRIEEKDVQARDIEVTQGDKKISLHLVKQEGIYHEHGDSNDTGDFRGAGASFSEYSGKSMSVPFGLDLTNINAIRYHFKDDKKIAHFLDKFVIVTEQEKKAYKQYAEKQDNLPESLRNEAGLLMKKIKVNQAQQGEVSSDSTTQSETKAEDPVQKKLRERAEKRAKAKEKTQAAFEAWLKQNSKETQEK